MSYYIKECEKKKEHHFFLQSIFILLLLQQAILENVSNSFVDSLISSLDEICGIALILVFCFKSSNKFKLVKEDYKIFFFSIVIIFIGLVSNLFSRLQPLSYAFVDILTCNKFIFIYLGIKSLYYKKIPEDFLYKNFNAIAKFFSVLFFILTIHDYLLHPFFEQVDFRYFASSTKLFYPHPTYLADACIILLCILISSYPKDKTNKIYICMLAFVIIMTLRAKAVVFIVAFCVLLICVLFLQIHSKFLLFMPLILSGIYVGWSQVQYYFFVISDSARAIMTRDCIKVANSFFPLGAGFATYGSHMANLHYSQLYFLFGYANFYGMTQEHGAFLSDTFWPIVIAQFGYVGLLCFLFIILNFLKVAFQYQKTDSYRFIALLSILMYMLISSTSESSFYNPFSAMFFLVFGIISSQRVAEKDSIPVESKKFKSKYFKSLHKLYKSGILIL